MWSCEIRKWNLCQKCRWKICIIDNLSSRVFITHVLPFEIYKTRLFNEGENSYFCFSSSVSVYQNKVFNKPNTKRENHKKEYKPTIVLSLVSLNFSEKKSNQSILKQISTEYSLEGLKLKMKLQYFGHLMWRTDSLERPCCWERLKANGERGSRGRDG